MSRSYRLRLIHRSDVTPVPTPQVLGVYEWVKCKGKSYRAILFELNERRVVDLLDEAASSAFFAGRKRFRASR